MKKLILYSALLLQVNVFAQAIPNGTFENWNTTAYSEPNGFSTGNLEDIQRTGNITVTKVAGYSGFAVRIQTVASGSDTTESYIINTTNPCSDVPQWKGGVPYSEQPTAITGYYRYNLPGSDTALMIVVFRKNGVHIADNIIQIRGTGSQSTWASFSFPITCGVVPDSMIFAAASSNKKGVGIQNGSFLELDNLAFTGTTQPFPNGDFENWTSKTWDNLSGWDSWGSGVSKSTSSYGGLYAVRFETVSDCGDNGNINPSGITSGHLTPNHGVVGGYPYTGTSDKFCGYYKYAPMGNDSAEIHIDLTKNFNNVGGIMHLLPAANNFTYFEVSFSSGIVPDTLRIDVQSSKSNPSSANIGSVLYLDDLYLLSDPLGIFNNHKNDGIFFYPNPAKEILNVQFKGKLTNEPKVITVYNTLGENIGSWKTDEKQIVLETKSFPVGIYLLQMKTANGVIVKKFVKE